MEKARARDLKTYQRSLAAVVRELVCGSDPNTIYILRGLIKEEAPTKGKQDLAKSRLSDTQTEATNLIEYIRSDACAVSHLLTDDDKAILRKIVREASKNAK